MQRLARERAEAQARRVPWQRLLHTRNQYIDWQEFSLWVRSVLESEDRVPDWLIGILNRRCPGFLENDKELIPKTAKNRPLPLRLEDWIDEHMFGFAKQEGWFNAITYNSIREPRYQKAEVCWSQCVKKWKKAKPFRYPTFEEWKLMAERCDPTAHLVPALRKRLAGIQRVDPVRFSEAVSRYVDWEALTYWARRALEVGRSLPDPVANELRERCPDFLVSDPGSRGWEELMAWIADRHFTEAKCEGWFDAILMSVRTHPRAIRTIEYADYCDEIWAPGVPDPYPSFQQWRREADAYVEPPATD